MFQVITVITDHLAYIVGTSRYIHPLVVVSLCMFFFCPADAPIPTMLLSFF